MEGSGAKNTSSFVYLVIYLFIQTGEIICLYADKMIHYGRKNRCCAEWGEGALLSSDLYRIEKLGSGAKVELEAYIFKLILEP